MEQPSSRRIPRLVLAAIWLSPVIAFVSVILLMASLGGETRRPFVPVSANQLVVVVAESSHSSEAEFALFNRIAPDREWRREGEWRKAVLGRNGMTMMKTEGDGKTPAGVFPLGDVYGHGDGFVAKENAMAWIKLVTRNMRCNDDPRSVFYNRVVTTGTLPEVGVYSQREMNGRTVKEFLPGPPPALIEMHDERHETAIVIGYNMRNPSGAKAEPVPGRGSCVFLRINVSGQPAEGSVALRASDMDDLLFWLGIGPSENTSIIRDPYIVLLPKAKYLELARQKRSGLPPLR